MVISDDKCTTLSIAGVLLELHSNAACGTQMPLAKALLWSSFCSRSKSYGVVVSRLRWQLLATCCHCREQMLSD